MTWLAFFLGFVAGAVVAGAIIYVWLVLMMHKDTGL